ncbi:MAG: 30S ribosomal protein S20 [Planctomycetota bacterium]
MPNTPSAKKRLRQTVDRTGRNKTQRSTMRTYEKRVLALIEAGDRPGAQALLPLVYKHIDRAAQKHILHANTAANHKSRIARKLAALS